MFWNIVDVQQIALINQTHIFMLFVGKKLSDHGYSNKKRIVVYVPNPHTDPSWLADNFRNEYPSSRLPLPGEFIINTIKFQSLIPVVCFVHRYGL